MSLRTPILSDEGLTLKTSYHLNHLFKALSLNVVALGAKVSTCECGGGRGAIFSPRHVSSVHTVQEESTQP